MRDAESFAEGFGGFVDAEAGVVGGKFKEDAAGFAEVDAVEVGAVLHGGDGELRGNDLAPGELCRVVRGAEGDVMHGACAGGAVARVRVHNDVDVVAERSACG